jgi:putative transposase
MRIPRNRQLAKGDIVHTTWRGHNKEWIFKNPADKLAYLDMIDEAAEKHDFELYAYAVMGTHDHNMGEAETVEGYSSFFQEVHGRYAQRYNRQHDRSGAVGSGRPKSIVIKDERHFLNAMFYSDANPVRAGVVRHPRHYPWSSHNFYAHGTRGPGTRALRPPVWYLNLGKTPRARQRAYRRQCDAYLRQMGLLPAPGRSSAFYAIRAVEGERVEVGRDRPAVSVEGAVVQVPDLAGDTS